MTTAAIITRNAAPGAQLPAVVRTAIDLATPLDAAAARAMSPEDILAALDALAAAIRDDGDTDPDAAAERYELLEGALARSNRAGSILNRHASHGAVDPSAIHVGTPKEDDTLDRAFDAFLRSGRPNADMAELATRAQETGTPAEGGFLVPESFRAKLVERMKEYGGILDNVETITTSDGRPMPFPTLDDTANSGEIVAEEAAPAGGADLVFGEKVLGAYKYEAVGAGAAPLRVSWELLQDAAFDVQALVARAFGTRIRRKMAADAVNGTGVGMPLGAAYGITPIEPAANTGHTYADLLEIIHAVDPAYRGSAKWYMADSTLAYFEGIEDGNDRPLLLHSGQSIAESPSAGRLLGYPIVIDQAFAAYDPDDDDVNMGLFGDLREGYVWRNVKDITLVVDPYTRALNGQTTFQAWARADGTVQNPNAYVAFSGMEA